MREAVAGVARNTTLPLWMYVTTSRHPAFANIAAISFIDNLFFPHTLMPRRKAT